MAFPVLTQNEDFKLARKGVTVLITRHRHPHAGAKITTFPAPELMPDKQGRNYL